MSSPSLSRTATERPLVDGLVAAVQRLAVCRDLDSVGRAVCRTARELLGCDGATFIIREGDGVRYRDEDALGPLWKGRAFPLGACICGWCILNRRAAVIEDIYSDPRIPVEAYRGTFVTSLMVVPVQAPEPIAAIGAYWADRHAATADEQAMLQAIADTTAVALENARLHEEAQHEIADRRLAEEALRESGERLRAALANGRLGMWEWDADADQVAGDAQLGELLGTGTACAMATAAFLAAVHPDDREEFRRQLDGALVGGLPIDGEFRVARPDGAQRWMACAGNAMATVPGRPRRVVGTARDVTAKRQLEERFLQSQKMEAVGRLAGGIAHDFNNLLTIIKGYGEALQQRMPPGDALLPKVLAIIRAGDRAAALTGQLLDLSRQRLHQPRTLDLNRRIGEIHAMLGRLLGEHIRHELDLAPEPCLVEADPGRIDQVLLNLVVNARDAMAGGGLLRISTRLRDGEVALAVRDSGCGMDAAVRARLFEPFFTTKRAGMGTGLGLATVHGIVQQHGGRIEVASEPRRGSTFTVVLPRSSARAEAPAAAAPAAPAPRGDEVILLVEDDDAMRTFALQSLGELGYRVLIACDAERALVAAAAHRGRVDLLLTDVVLPGESGRVLAGRLAEARPGLRTLFMSGYTDDAVLAHGVRRGEVAFLQKPFTAADLGRAVRAALAGC